MAPQPPDALQRLKNNKLVSSALTLFMIIAWYGANIGCVISNKGILSHTRFKQPVFLTMCHMVACAVYGVLISVTGCMPLKRLTSVKQFAKISVLSIIFCGTIVLGNSSLKYLPVSFNQAIGATTPAFTAVFAFLLQGSREHMLTYAALVPVMGGVVVTSGGEPLFHALGFMLCMSATAGRALKTVVQAMIMTDPSEKLDPMSLLTYMSGVSIALLLPMTWILEPGAFTLAASVYASNGHFAWWLLVNASLAFLANLLNFLVTFFTSALTLQVLGNAKGVVAAFVSVLLFKNPVTAQGIIGYAITVAGVVLYSEAKKRAKEHKGQGGQGQGHAGGAGSKLGQQHQEQGGSPSVKAGMSEPSSATSTSAARADLTFRSEREPLSSGASTRV